MNLIETFGDWLIEQSVMTSGQLYISRVPSGPNAPDTLWWLKAEGGADLSRYVTGESIQNTVIGVYYRDTDPQAVYNRLEALRNLVVCAGCLTLEGYTIKETPTTQGPFTDQDLDNEEREVGTLKVVLTTSRSC